MIVVKLILLLEVFIVTEITAKSIAQRGVSNGVPFNNIEPEGKIFVT